eukprot:s268_g10.t1
MLDSGAELDSRAKAIGPREEDIQRLHALGYGTLGRLAFASNYTPGQSDEGPLLALARKITDSDPVPDERLPPIRRLVFEAYTLASADLRSRIDRRDDDGPCKLTQAERSSRQADQTKRLQCLDLSGELEPSYTLVDLVFQMQEDNCFRYVRWEQCTKRDQELMGVKTVIEWKPDAAGVVRETKVSTAPTSDNSTDLKLEKALQRRSLAFDQARLLDYNVFERWTQTLMEAYGAEPPHGHQRVSLEQLHRADLELFKFIIKETRSGIRPTAGVQPMKAAIEAGIVHPKVLKHLQPLPGAHTKTREPPAHEVDKTAAGSSTDVPKLKRTIENLQGQLRNMRARGTESKGKGKGSGGKARGRGLIRMPAGLIGQSPVGGIQGAPTTALLCLELCAGCARLSRSLQAAGFKAMAVDHSKNRHRQLYSCVSLDLADEEACHTEISLLKAPGAVLFVHASPPDGTTRKPKKVTSRMAGHGATAKRIPLRSRRFPDGLPRLQGVQLLQLQHANRLYKNLAAILETAISYNALISIEGSLRSPMWSTKWIKKLIATHSLQAVDFQQCMWGGSRDKWSRLYVNSSAFDPLARSCDHSHSHSPWALRTLKAEEEIEHAQPFCDKVAELVLAFALQQGALLPQQPAKKTKTKLSAERSAQAGWQPRGNKLPQIVSEFSTILRVPWPLPPPSRLPREPLADEREYFHLVGPCKLLKYRRANPDEELFHDIVEVGVYRTPEEFLEEALRVSHPFDSDASVPDDVKRTIFKLLTEGPELVQREREQAFQYYEELKISLEQEEQCIHECLPTEREKVLRQKRFKLFEAMCFDAGIDIEDSGLDLLLAGVPLTGKGPACAFFDEEHGEPALTEEQLMRSSRWSRRRVLGRASSSASVEIRDEVWRLALEEQQQGWLLGPFTEAELASDLGPRYIVSRRFGLAQSDKTRPIDDMSDSLVNAAFAAGYKLDLPGLDGVAIMARTFLEATTAAGLVRLKSSSGMVLKGFLHASLTVDEARTLVGRTLDLESAYKQMVVAPQSMWTSVLAVEDDSGSTRLFKSLALPFGASASVFAFNKIARTLNVLGTRLFHLAWSNFYDDYIQLDVAKSKANSQVTAERMLSLLGWDFSRKASKRKPFSAEFDALGATFDFSTSQTLKFLVKNKASRVSQIVESVGKILVEQSLSSKAAAALRGRLQFAESQTFGRALAANLKAFSARAAGQLAGNHITPELTLELEWILNFLQLARPRELCAGMQSQKVVIFTDAALEDHDRQGSVGMVAFVVKNEKVVAKFFFSERVPSELMRKIQSKTLKARTAPDFGASKL